MILEEDGSILANAKLLQERVIVPRRQVRWIFHGWRAGPILAADAGAVLLFDLEARRLHTISTPDHPRARYAEHEIVHLFLEKDLAGADVHLCDVDTILSVRDVALDQWERALHLARIHTPTFTRLQALRAA